VCVYVCVRVLACEEPIGPVHLRPAGHGSGTPTQSQDLREPGAGGPKERPSIPHSHKLTLPLIAQEFEGHGVGDGEGQEAEVEGSLGVGEGATSGWATFEVPTQFGCSIIARAREGAAWPEKWQAAPR